MSDLVLEGRVAVVTGAGRGIGASIAQTLARAGADLLIAGRTLESLERVRASIEAMERRAEVVVMDVRDPDGVKALQHSAVTLFGTVDILVNNAGIGGDRPFLEMTQAEWSEVFDTNLGGTVRVSQAIGELMVRRRSGKVINVASTFAFKGVPQFAAYCASKAAIVSLTRTLAVEWAASNVQVNAVAPGYVATDFNIDVRKDPALAERILRQIPARRFGETEDLSDILLLLANPAVRYITGQTFVVDGGQLAR